MPSSDARAAWDRFARSDALYFIETDPAKRRDLETFAAGGEATAAWALEWVGERTGRDRLLEIGCGVGRTARAFAARFEHVDAVDVSPAMLDLARDLDPPANVRFALSPGDRLPDELEPGYDLVFAHLVFQHVPDETAIARHLRDIGRLLAPGGRALLQFDTRPRSRLAELRDALPDRLLPRRHRRHMRRYRRDATRLHEHVTQADLEVEEERDPGTALHWLLLRRAAG